MKKADRLKRKKHAKKLIEQNIMTAYKVNAGGHPRLSALIDLPNDAPDSEYFIAFKQHAVEVLFPLKDNPKMGLHDRGLEGDTLLHVACYLGDLRAVRLLIGAGVEIDVRDGVNETALHCAVSGRYLDIVKYLLTQGASPNIKGAFGYTPLEWAIQMKYDDIVSIIQKSYRV